MLKEILSSLQQHKETSQYLHQFNVAVARTSTCFAFISSLFVKLAKSYTEGVDRGVSTRVYGTAVEECSTSCKLHVLPIQKQT